MKKVLILASEKTGSGHKSSSDAIEKKLKEAEYECRRMDAFPLMGKTGNWMEASYIPLTTRAPFLFYLIERSVQYFPGICHAIMYRRIKKELLKLLEEYRPDVIISVHGMFTRSVSRIIRKNHLNIPFYIGVVDLVDPPRVWEDNGADMTFVPTEQIREQYLKKGFQNDRVMVSGFPIRDDIEKCQETKQLSEPLQILMLNSSTNLRKNILFVREISRLENVQIRFVCGLDKRLFLALTRLQKKGKLPDRVTIYGFLNDMNRHLKECHIILTKAGPNAILEAVRSGTAVVITGHIIGHEAHNYEYILQNGYGIRCEDPRRIYEELDELIKSGKLKKCLENTISDELTSGAERIAEYVMEHI